VTTANAAIPILDQAGRALGGFLPRLGGALVLLVVGLLLARVLGWATRRGLARIGVDDLSARLGVQPVLERAGLGSSLVRLLGRIVRIVVSIVAIFAALSLLGLQFLSQSLNQAVLALPELLIAAALVLVGIVLGGWVGERIERASYQMDLPLPLGRLAQVASAIQGECSKTGPITQVNSSRASELSWLREQACTVVGYYLSAS